MDRIDEYGDMRPGLMCLNCGRIAPTPDLYWNYVFDYKSKGIYLLCPDCHHFNCIVNITYMILDGKEVKDENDKGKV